LIAYGWTRAPESVINRVGLLYWPNAVLVYYDTVEVQTCTSVKANFNANFWFTAK